MKKLFFVAVIALLSGIPATLFAQNRSPIRVAIAGVSHGHVGEVIRAAERGEVEIVGVFEADAEVRAGSRLAKMYSNVVYDNLAEMLDKVRPEAVMAYGSIYDHLSVVEASAPRGIHVMVEKPLAVSPEHAKKMAKLARENNIHLLTNYETTWYATNHKAYEMVEEGEIGQIRRINVYDGHQGPVEIKCGPEFLAWLTDPVLNGGGAVIDFGCYGANLVTWLLHGQRPLSVYAVLQHQKPEIYPKVDDDATILVEYPGCTVEIMASWNWPLNRKDMHIYGQKGYIYQDTGSEMRYGFGNGRPTSEKLAGMPAPYNTPFVYFTAVVRGQIEVKPTDLSALENNLTVVDILDAAKESSRTGKVIKF